MKDDQSKAFNKKKFLSLLASRKPEDGQELLDWFATPALEEELLMASLDYWKELTPDMTLNNQDEKRMLNRIQQQIRQEEAGTFTSRKMKMRGLKLLSRVAAVLFLPLLALSCVLWLKSRQAPPLPIDVSIYAPLGARTQFHLPDGSSGWLNSGTKLHFPAYFSGDFRTVSLEGEAFFDVVTDPEHPFVVQTDKIQVVALGTSFNVNAYPDDETSSVALTSGSVELYRTVDTGKTNPLERMQAGRLFTYFNSLDSYVTDSLQADKATAWKEGRLVFRDDPMEEVVRRLNRWYNVDIQIVDDQVRSHSYWATFEDESLEEILKLLEVSSPIEIEDLGRELLDNHTFSKRKILLTSK